MASITVPTNYDMRKIAELAGNGDVESRVYRDGKLEVRGVSQQALEDGLAAYAALGYPAPERPQQIVISPDGTKWAVTVGDDGKITTKEVANA